VDGNLVLPPNAFSLNPERYKSSITVQTYEIDEKSPKIIFYTNKGLLHISLFDHVTAKVIVQESRAHLPMPKLELLHFGLRQKPKIEMINTEIEEQDSTANSDRTEDEFPLEEDESEYKQTSTDISLYSLLDKLDQSKLNEDTFLSLSLAVNKQKKIGKRIFREEEYKKEQPTPYNENSDGEETTSSTLPYVPPITSADQSINQRFSKQIGTAEKAVKIKLVRKVNIIKKQKAKPS